MMRVAPGLLVAALATALVSASAALAQPRPQPAGTPPELIDGPPAPIAPAVMTRDEQGRTTVRAIRLDEAIGLDGVLDEPVYAAVPAITSFIQQVPDIGASATERTEAWILFDETNVYVSARVWDSAPESQWVANEMRRDTNQLRQNDTFAVFFDTFYDRRNGFNFYTNPLGARADQQFTNEGNPNGDWNPVWDVRTGRFDGGWTLEMEIPFKTLRYRSEPPYVWGIQLRRAIRRKNEWVYLTRLPISAGGGSGAAGIFRVSAAGSLVGLEPPPASRNLEVKPYVIGGVTTDRTAFAGDRRAERRRRHRRQVRHHPEADRGFHLEHRLCPGGGGRAAGQPDPLPAVLSREARVLPRGPGYLRLRTRRRHRPARGAGERTGSRGLRGRQRPAALLQPEDWPRAGARRHIAGGADCRRRAGDVGPFERRDGLRSSSTAGGLASSRRSTAYRGWCRLSAARG